MVRDVTPPRHNNNVSTAATKFSNQRGDSSIRGFDRVEAVSDEKNTIIRRIEKVVDTIFKQKKQPSPI